MIFDDTRTTWRARPPLRALTAVPHHARLGRVWHWAGPAIGLHGKPHSLCLAQVRDWQLQHQTRPTDPWKDIGYNGLICVHARAIEGRGLGYSGSHAPSWNTTRWGFQFMVGEGEQVTPAMFARAVVLARDVEALAGHDLDDKSHRDDPKVSTACAGPQVTAWVRDAGPEKSTPTTPPPKDEVMDFTVENTKQIVTRPGIVRDVRVANPDAVERVSLSALVEDIVEQVRAGRGDVTALIERVAALGAPRESAPLVTREELLAVWAAACQERLDEITITDGGAS